MSDNELNNENNTIIVVDNNKFKEKIVNLLNLTKRSVPMFIKTFYNKEAVKNYASNEKGHGLYILFLTSIIMSIYAAIKALLLVSVLSTAPIEEWTKDIPDIEIKNDEIIAPENFTYTKDLPAEKLGFSFDTSHDIPVINPNWVDALYIGKRNILIVNNNQGRLLNYNKLVNGAHVKIVKSDFKKIYDKAITLLKKYVPPVCFFIGLPIMFFTYLLEAYVFSVICSLLIKILKANQINFAERMRYSVLAMLPSIMITLITGIFNYAIPYPLTIMVLITLVFLLSFIKEKEQSFN
ncbi:MAG: DUF1189 domain-containing protein [Alphaproteobacteria bacterium]|nr:DUF1189 domain-containing protein [Alphaproteobacteria bacterium]